MPAARATTSSEERVEPPEGQEAAEQDGEGQDLQRDEGQPQPGDLRHQGEAGVRRGWRRGAAAR